MTFKRSTAILLAVLMAAAMLAFAACSGKEDEQQAQYTEEPTAEPTAVPTEAPTPEPTEVPGPDLGDVFDRFNSFIGSPCIDTIKGVLPVDFFNGLQQMMDEALAEAGMGYQDLGYADFDSMLEDMFDPETMSEAFTTDAVGKLASVDFDVKDWEEADMDYIKEKLGNNLEYLDEDKLTAAYKLTVDITAVGVNGVTDTTKGETIYVYEYDGLMYICMD